jgi:hypothetical protein
MPFNFEQYTRECRNMSDYKLQKELESYSRQSYSGGASYGIGLALIPFTFGLSALGSVAATATMANALTKVHILEKESNNRNVQLSLRKRDIFYGAGVGATAGLASHGAGGHLLGSVAHHAAQHAHHVISPTGEHILNYADKGTNKACNVGSKSLEKMAYGKASETRKQYGDGKFP